MPNYLVPMTLSDLLDRTARLTGKIFGRSFILAGIVMLPAGVIMGFALRELFAALSDTFHYIARDPNSADAVIPFLYGMGEFSIAVLLWVFSSCIMQAAAIDLTDAEINYAGRTWQGTFTRAWHKAFRIFAQNLMRCIVVISVCAILGAVVGRALAAAALIIPAVVFIVWLLVQWSLGGQAVLCEESGPMSGLYRSGNLIRGSWWRVTGLLLFFGVLVAFAISLISTPLYGYAVLPLIIRMHGLQPGSEDYAKNFGELCLTLSPLGWTFGFIMALSTTIKIILYAAYKTLLYYDLRARQGEFEVSIPQAPIPAQ